MRSPAVDVFVDDDGVWSTADPGVGDPRPKPVPTVTGVGQGVAWPIPVDGSLPVTVAGLVADRSVSRRTAGLAQWVAMVADVARDRAVVPEPAADGWVWRAAPDAAAARRLHAAEVEAESVGLFVADTGDDGQAVEFTGRILNALLARQPAVGGVGGRPARRERPTGGIGHRTRRRSRHVGGVAAGDRVGLPHDPIRAR